jgi:hypothetical protein
MMRGMRLPSQSPVSIAKTLLIKRETQAYLTSVPMMLGIHG